MKFLRQLTLILIICFLGEVIHILFHLPIPGNVIGMIILIICLCTKIINVDSVNEVSTFLLDHLAFFFIPAGVGLISCFNLLKGKWIPLLLICLISTIIVIAVTGLTIELIVKITNSHKQQERR